MFRSRKETTHNHQTYSRLQQQDDGDDDLDYEDWSDLAQHPNSVLVTNTTNNINDGDNYATVVLPQPIDHNGNNNSGSNSSNNNSNHMLPPSAIPTAYAQGAQPSTTTNNNNNNNSSFLPNDTLAKLPQTTRDYFHNKWLPSKANKATLANMPPAIVSDIQQGNIPSHADPTLRELDVRGWTIAHRRLYRLRKQKKKKKKSKKAGADGIGGGKHMIPGTSGGDTTDDDGNDTYLDSSLQPSNQLSASVFIKIDYDDTGSTQQTSSPDDIKIKGQPIPVSKNRYLQIVESVQLAINDNIQPTRISQGSSGSYFCRDRDNKIVGVFKPKNEEPYGQLNPKWAKWLHRHLFPCFFGRSCLIPNLGYISEAAASLVDRQLGTCIVPTTHLDHFTSPSFHYDYLDRRRYRHSPQQHPLPLKIGSFQCFLHGYRDANVFLRDNPWPLETSSSSLVRFGGGMVTTGSAVWGHCMGQSEDDDRNSGHDGNDDDDDDGDATKSKRMIGSKKSGYQPVATSTENNNDAPSSPHGSANGGYVALQMGSASGSSGDDEENDSDTLLRHRTSFYRKNKPPQKPTFQWTLQLQLQFKKEFEHLVILDYLIRNTDRGLDNWMIRYCEGTASTTHVSNNNNQSSSSNNSSNATVIMDQHHEEHRPTGTSSCIHGNTTPHIHIAAIDNGLAFPFKHPDEWRSYPYGWLALPSSLVARPFSPDTRRRFLPILSDPVWWHQTVEQLRRLFQVDTDFNERMFQRQMAVLRGQGYNLVRVLKDPHAGPLDLVAMERVLVNQEEIFIEYDEKRMEERLPSRKKKNHHHQQQQQLSTPPSESSSLSDRPSSAAGTVAASLSSPSSVPVGTLHHHHDDTTTSAAVATVSSSMPSQQPQHHHHHHHHHQDHDPVLQSPLSISPSSTHQQRQKSKNSTRRLRPKRSTSFNAYDSSAASALPTSSNNNNNNNKAKRNKKDLPWKDRVRKRLSLDLGRRRLTLRHIVGSDGEMQDDDDYLSIDSFDDTQEPVRKRLLLVMETVKLVKSKLPYFSCC
ncbi:unnamed protein product [Absidia cylindrospora]